MSETAQQSTVWEERLAPSRFAAGGVSGFLAGIVMGLMLQFGTDLLPLLGGLTGNRSLLFGWVVHLMVSVAFGLAFVVLVALPLANGIAEDFSGMVLLAVVHAFGFAIALLGGVIPMASLLLPPDAGLAATPAPGVPGIGQGGLLNVIVFGVGHLVYGMVLGAVYYFLHR